MSNVALWLGLVSLALFAASHAATHIVLSQRRRRALWGGPLLTILKPVKGCDPGLYENLVSLARQRYGRFQLVVGAADPNDPALTVAARVKQEYPRLDLTLVRGSAPFGHNPKVENLATMSAHAKYDLVLISDANVRAAPDYLAAITQELDDGVGLVSSVLAGRGGAGFGGMLEDLQLNAFVASTVCAADFAGHPCVIGKSMLFRLSDFEKLGGFAAVKDVLAEDYLIGQLFHRAGFRVSLSTHVLTAMSGNRPFGDFWNRHLRWHQMRRWVAPLPYAAEPLLNPVPLLCAVALVLPVAVWGVAAKCLADSLLHYRLTGRWLMPWHWPLVVAKDFLVLAMWAAGAAVRTVHWRGKRMWLGRGSMLGATPAPASRKEAA